MRMMKRMRVESSRRKKSTYIDIWSLRCSRRRAHTAKILTHGREAKKPSALAADADPRHITLESISSDVGERRSEALSQDYWTTTHLRMSSYWHSLTGCTKVAWRQQ